MVNHFLLYWLLYPTSLFYCSLKQSLFLLLIVQQCDFVHRIVTWIIGTSAVSCASLCSLLFVAHQFVFLLGSEHLREFRCLFYTSVFPYTRWAFLRFFCYRLRFTPSVYVLSTTLRIIVWTPRLRSQVRVSIVAYSTVRYNMPVMFYKQSFLVTLVALMFSLTSLIYQISNRNITWIADKLLADRPQF